MSVMRRLFVAPESCSPTPLPGMPVALSPEESHYACRVLRLGPKDNVELLDGAGRMAPATLGGSPKALTATPTAPFAPTPALARVPQLTVAVAMPKGERADWLAEKLAELAIFRLQWLICERSVVQPQARHLVRIERLMRAAARQARHGRIPLQPQPISLFDFVATPTQDTKVVLDHQAGPALASSMRAPLRLIVGPEGGLTPEELQAAARHSYSSASLGPCVLRVETAAIVAAGLFLAHSAP